MQFFSFFFFIVFSLSSSVLAWVDQDLINNVFSMTSPGYKKDTDPISRSVQTINMLAHELSLYTEEKRATSAAKSIISMIAKGEGVKGGLRKKTHKRRFLSESEKELTLIAMTKAVDYLQKQNLFDQFLTESIESMGGIWESDEATRKHGSIVLSLLLAAREKTKGNDIDSAMAKVEEFIPDEDSPLRKALLDGSRWQYAAEYMQAALPDYKYNAIEWGKIEFSRKWEEEIDKNKDYAVSIPKDFPVRALTPIANDIQFIKQLADELEKTLIPEKALALSKQLIESLKHKDTDLKLLTNPLEREGAFRRQVIRALVAVEKFRAFEIKVGELDKINPNIFDYINDQANPKTQAILVALVSSIKNYLYNPNLDPLSLVRLFSYQINDRRLARLGKELKDLDPLTLIDEELIIILKKNLPLNQRQKILIDQENLKQGLKFFWRPTFNKTTGEMTKNPTFTRYYGSSGYKNQCGFFSLGFESREEAKNQIIDNLKDQEIFALADIISGTSASIKASLEKLKNGMLTEVEEEDILKKIKANINFLEDNQALREYVLEIYAEIEQKEKEVDSKIDVEKEAAGFPQKVPEPEEIAFWMMIHENEPDFENLSAKKISKRTEQEKDLLLVKLSEFFKKPNFPTNSPERKEFKKIVPEDRISAAEQVVMDVLDQLRDFRLLKTSSFYIDKATFKKAEINSRLVKLFYSLEDFQNIIKQDMHNVFAQQDSGEVFDVGESEEDELLEFPPNPEWKINTPTYPLLMAILNNYDIGGWTSKEYLRILQSQRIQKDKIIPIYQSENNKEFALISYIATTEDAKRVDIVNKGGGHFEKLIQSQDHAQAVRALRHAATYGKSGLARDTRAHQLR